MGASQLCCFHQKRTPETRTLRSVCSGVSFRVYPYGVRVKQPRPKLDSSTAVLFGLAPHCNRLMAALPRRTDYPHGKRTKQ